MNFKNIFARFWALWSILMFSITFLITYIPAMLCILIPGLKGHTWFRKMGSVWIHSWLPLVGCPVKITGRENFEKGKIYIVAFNHNSLLDPTLSSPFIPGANKTIAKSSFAKIPIFGWYYAHGSILVDRTDMQSRKKSFIEMKKTLSSGMHVSIYPEGTRNQTTEPLKKFQDGAFKLAVDTQVSIIPAMLFNTKKVMPNNQSFYFLPHKLRLDFLLPIPSENKTVEALKEEVYTTMIDYFTKNNK